MPPRTVHEEEAGLGAGGLGPGGALGSTQPREVEAGLDAAGAQQLPHLLLQGHRAQQPHLQSSSPTVWIPAGVPDGALPKAWRLLWDPPLQAPFSFLNGDSRCGFGQCYMVL